MSLISPAGAFLIDKPEHLTSSEVVTKIKWALINHGYAQKGFKIGHGGTLDPFATGVLGVLLGEATKFADCYLHSKKSYEGIIALGSETTTGDYTGEITQNASIPPLSLNDWQNLAQSFVDSPYLQTPPMFSAKKTGGKALYELARQGIEIEREAILKKISQFKLSNLTHETLFFETECESGTYVRVLAEDLAKKAGTKAHLKTLRRTASSDLKITRALPLSETLKLLEQKTALQHCPHFIPLHEVASHIPSLYLSEDIVKELKQGLTRVLPPIFEKLETYSPRPKYVIARLGQTPCALFEFSSNSNNFRLQRIINSP